MALAVVLHKSKDVPAQLDRVSVSPIVEGALPFTLYPFEEPIDRPLHAVPV